MERQLELINWKNIAKMSILPEVIDLQEAQSLKQIFWGAGKPTQEPSEEWGQQASVTVSDGDIQRLKSCR